MEVVSEMEEPDENGGKDRSEGDGDEGAADGGGGSLGDRASSRQF